MSWNNKERIVQYKFERNNSWLSGILFSVYILKYWISMHLKMQIPISFPLDISVERVISNVRFCSHFCSCDINFESWSERTFQYAHTLCRSVVRLIEIQRYIEQRRDGSSKCISRVRVCIVTFVRIDRCDWFFMRVTFAICMQMSIRLPIKSWQLHTISKIRSEQSRRKRAKLYSIQDVLRSSLRDISCPAFFYIYIYILSSFTSGQVTG
jgi:hypothetical protein